MFGTSGPVVWPPAGEVEIESSMIITRELDGSFPDASAEPIVAYKTWRVVDGELRSRFVPVGWSGPVLEADCFRDLPTPFRSTSRYVDAPHVAPHPGCCCGIHAEIAPDLRTPKVDFRGVTGIVALWGRIHDAPGGMLRAEFARVCALGLYAHASPRQRAAVAGVADRFEADLVDLRELQHAAPDYGEVLSPVLLHA